MLYGIDISNWQKGIDLAQGNYDFCICKATEGTWYIDKQLKDFAVQLTALNKLIGVYHFARPDKDNTVNKIKDEADFFVTKIKEQRLLGKAILCLDWETEPMDRPDLMRAWLERVVQSTGIIPFVYSSKSKFQSWVGKEEWEFLYDYGVWLAQWPSIKKYEVGVNPEISIQWAPPWGWDIWQYSSNGYLGPNSTRVDLNMTQLTYAEWDVACHPQGENISEDMKWAIDCGLFRGYGDGTYRPKESVTREQLATVLRRYIQECSDKLILNSAYGALYTNTNGADKMEEPK